MRPITDLGDEPMFDRMMMDIIHMPDIVAVIADFMS
jgi:hypothetical protein